MSEQHLRIKRLEIEELFGPQTSHIDLTFRLDERVTVLHGRNGAGKTITLQLLHAVCSGELSALTKYPIKLFRLTLSDGSVLEVHDTQGEGRFWITPGSAGQEGQPEPIEGQLRDLDERDVRRMRLRQVEALLRSGLYEAQAAIAMAEEPADDLVLRISGLRRQLAEVNQRYQSSTTSTLQERLKLPGTKLIPTNRLHYAAQATRGDTSPDEPTRPRPMVSHIGEQLGREIQRADREYREISTELDRSLPSRIVTTNKDDCPLVDVLRERYEKVRQQEERLREVGLIRDLPPPVIDDRFTSEHRATLSIILEDREKKLQPFQRVAERTSLLLETLNAKLYPKSVTLDPERGYQVRDPGGQSFDLSHLSSGEQHELVLLHELLFDIEAGTTILIDEPELSLHVTWQEQVLPDLLKIAEVADLDFVLATHSPYIVGDRYDLMERLGEPVQGVEAAK